MMGQAWRRLNAANLRAAYAGRDMIFIARRSDGKCCIGYVESWGDKNVLVENQNNETLLWFNEPRMFVFIEPPTPGEIRIAERELPLQGN